jgi:RimJ/RimL family protein N-acetyltransferase
LTPRLTLLDVEHVRHMDRGLVLETERLILRPFRTQDLPVYAEINADPAVVEFLGGIPLSRAVSDEQADGANRCFATRRFGKIAVERRGDGTFLGMCGLSIEAWFPHDLEIGWRFGSAYWGNGYATEAASAWLAYAFESLGTARVISVADAPNMQSIAVMRQIGMRFNHAPRLSDESGEFEAVVYSMDAALYREHASLGTII